MKEIASIVSIGDDPSRKGGGGKENFRLEAKEREEAVEGGRWGVGSITRERNLV